MNILISLEGNQIGDEGAVAFAEMLKINKTLEKLKYAKFWYFQSPIKFWFSCPGNKVTDVGAIALAESLIGNTSLTNFG